MRKRGIGILFFLALVIAAASIFQDSRLDALLTTQRDGAVATERDLGSLEATVASVRAAQAGYVASGQVPATWMTRGTERLQSLESTLHARKAASHDQAVVRKYDAAIASLGILKSVDAQIRASLDQGDRIRASDEVFLDGEDAANRLLADVSAIRTLEAQSSGQRIAQTATLRLALNAAGLLLLVLVAAYFGRALSILAVKPPVTMAQMIRDLPPPVKTGNAAASVAAPAPVPVLPAPSTVPVVTTGPLMQRPAALSAAAELCVDLARLLDGRDIPALLERASSVLDAKGIMIWSVDADEAVLRPSLSHGYSERVTRKIRPLPVADENITSQAMRSLQTQTMAGAGPGDSAAIAIPMIAANGCVGVMAAEIRQSRPHGDVIALARIIAAQFTTLVAPADESLGRTAEA